MRVPIVLKLFTENNNMSTEVGEIFRFVRTSEFFPSVCALRRKGVQNKRIIRNVHLAVVRLRCFFPLRSTTSEAVVLPFEDRQKNHKNMYKNAHRSPMVSPTLHRCSGKEKGKRELLFLLPPLSFCLFISPTYVSISNLLPQRLLG